LFKVREGKPQQQPEVEPTDLQAEYFVPKERPVKNVFVEDVIPPKSKQTIWEDRFNQVSKLEDGSVQNKSVAEKKKDEQKIVLPKQKFVNVKTLDSAEQESELKAGEIKWR
jgi:hypothetical protein